jgi:hypothetical protein
LLFRPVQAVDPDDVGAGTGEPSSALAGRVALVGPWFGLLEAHRDHHRETGDLRPLHEQHRLAQVAERLAHPEVRWPGIQHVLELAVEQRAHVLGRRGIPVIVGPREREVARHQRITFGCDFPRHLHRVPVDLVDLVLQADGGQLVVARVERHRGQELGARTHELPMELGQRLRVLDGDLGCERSGLDVAPLLQLQQVPAVAKHRPFGQALQNPLRHVGTALSNPVRSVRRV